MSVSGFSSSGTVAKPKAPVRQARAGAVAWPRLLRQWHLYVGVFFAPAILFLALTGAAQTFNLHKADRADGYRPPAWVVALAGVHKRQTLAPKADDNASVDDKAKPGGHKRNAKASAQTPAQTPPLSVLLLKLFTLGAALSLAFSTLSGLYLALRFSRRPILVTGLAGAGALVPALLLLV